ncbi:MAG: ATP-binding protein [Candidatus Cloacimonadota bacterium]|nr:ATP-binding protein [Candidatus Cloacimonadota bacterium]
MKLPSFKFQILGLIFILLLVFGVLTRDFFINQFADYTKDNNSIRLYRKTHDLYENHKEELQKDEIQPILRGINQIELNSYLFEQRMTNLSTYYIVATILILFLIFVILINLLLKPLTRLQNATEKVRAGDLTVNVRESRFSPINELIRSFNEMVTEIDGSREKLIQAEKDLMWREMAQVLAHEIKNPLTPLRLATERLEMKHLQKAKNFDDVFTSSIEVINEEISNLQKLVKEFSQFAKMPTTNFVFCDVNCEIRKIILPYVDSADIHLDLQDDLPQFECDKLQMKQVFVNLIQNAIHAISSNGNISILSKFEDDKFIFVIQDDGEGIDKKNINEIFRPYFTNKVKGTGLGLAIVRRIIKEHNGTISVESEKGEGSKFTMIFTNSMSSNYQG